MLLGNISVFDAARYISSCHDRNMLRQAATERAATAAEAGWRMPYVPSTKGWKRYGNSCTYSLHSPSSQPCLWAGGHRNLQWFLRTGPHAQGLNGSGGIAQGMTSDQTQKIQLLVCKCHKHWNILKPLIWYIVYYYIYYGYSISRIINMAIKHMLRALQTGLWSFFWPWPWPSQTHEPTFPIIGRKIMQPMLNKGLIM